MLELSLITALKILIAEDDEAIMTSYKLVLKQRNHEIFAASDGDQCLRIFNEHNDRRGREGRLNSKVYATPFDVVILDYRMPKKDGVEVAKYILSTVPDQRIIIATAYTHELSVAKAAKNHSCIEMLQKPFEFDLFLEVVEGKPVGQTAKGTSKKHSPDANVPLSNFHSNHRLDDQFTKMGNISKIF